MNTEDKIIIYVQDKCGYCKIIKEELEANNIAFETKSVEQFGEQWGKIVGLTSLPTTPTICYKNSYFVPSRDFINPKQLVLMLKTFKQSEFSETRQTLEKVKTLNSNINIAFGRLDQLLKKIENKLNTEENEHKSTD